MACHIDFRNQVLDGKRGEWTGFSKTSLHARKQPGLNEARRDKRPAGALTPLEQRELDEHSSMQVTEQSVRSVDPTATHGKINLQGVGSRLEGETGSAQLGGSEEQSVNLLGEKDGPQSREESISGRHPACIRVRTLTPVELLVVTFAPFPRVGAQGTTEGKSESQQA
eukprot:scaffold1741_cov409-Prasinococcus_capsulatus_cf.AAC.6